MNDELTPAATPPNGGNNQPPANQSGNKKGSEPKEEPEPTKITWEGIFEFGGTGLCLWVWAEIVGCHSLLTLCFLAATLTFFQTGPCHFVYKIFKKTRCSFHFALGLWMCLTVAAWFMVWINSRPPALQPPTLSQETVQFGTGVANLATEVKVFNPNPFPLYSVMVIARFNKSVVLKSPAEALGFFDMKDLLPSGAFGPASINFTGSNTLVLGLTLNEIPPNSGYRQIQFHGITRQNLSATLSIFHFDTNDTPTAFWNDGKDWTGTNPPPLN